MAATLARCVFDHSGNLLMVVVPDDDAQLDDPAFSPANSVGVNVALPTDGTPITKDNLGILAIAALAQIDANLAALAQTADAVAKLQITNAWLAPQQAAMLADAQANPQAFVDRMNAAAAARGVAADFSTLTADVRAALTNAGVLP